MSYWYVATPYTRFPGGIDAAFKMACFQTALLIKEGVPAFSPIAHTHPIAEAAEIDPLDLTYWLPVDAPMMRAAIGIIVVKAETWEESNGVAHEIKHFADAGKPIVYMEPGVVPVMEIEAALDAIREPTPEQDWVPTTSWSSPEIEPQPWPEPKCITVTLAKIGQVHMEEDPENG